MDARANLLTEMAGFLRLVRNINRRKGKAELAAAADAELVRVKAELKELERKGGKNAAA